MDGAPSLRGSAFHYQLYSPEPGPTVKWRLLSGNNRDMGRGTLAYADAVVCVIGITEMLQSLEQCAALFIPDGGNSWRWFLRLNGEQLVCSGHAYDRKIRCREGLDQFLRFAPGAEIRRDVVASSARRWSNAGIDLRDGPAATMTGRQASGASPAHWATK